MRSSVVLCGRALDIPKGLSARLDLRRKKLLRMSQQRGMLENELIIGSYVIENIEKMDEQSVDELEAVLDEQDPDVVKWLTKREAPPEDLQSNKVLIELIEWAQSSPLQRKQ
jgi:succinate dehydrogenase flavin-adding protein (antitoxin of CptAB toxin-antitoxin module)